MCTYECPNKTLCLNVVYQSAMSTFDEQFEKFMNEPLSSESITKNSSEKVSSPLEVKAVPIKPKDLWWVKNSSKRFGETSQPEPKDAGNYISSKSPACSDVASSLAEFLQKEKIYKEQNSSKGMTPASGGGDLTDDDLSSIKEQLSVGDGTEKSVEEILKEYEQMQENSVMWKPYVEMVADHSNHSEKNNSMNSGDGGGEKSIEEIFKEYEEEQQKNEESWRHYCEIMSGHSTLSGENSLNSSNKLSGTGSVSEKTMEDIIKEFNEVSQQNAERMKKMCVDQPEPKNGTLKPPVKRRKDHKSLRHANVDGSFPASDGQDSMRVSTEYQDRRLSSSLTNHSECSTSEESDKVVGNISSSDIPIALQATDTFPVNSKKNNVDTLHSLTFSVSSNEMDLNQLKMSKKVNDSKTPLQIMSNVENVASQQLIEELLPSELVRMEEQLPIDEDYNTDSEVLTAQGVDLGVVGSAGSVEVNAETPDERDVLSTVIEESSVETSVEESKRGEVKGAAGEISVSSTELNRIKSLEWELAQEQKKVFDLKCTLETKENEFAKQRKILKQKYEMQIFELQKDIRILKAQIAELQAEGTRQKAAKDGSGEEQRIALLEKELQQQEQLILGCQRENLRLCQDIRQAKEQLKAQEAQFSSERQQLQTQLLSAKQRSINDSCVERESLLERIKNKEETILKLKLEADSLKAKNEELRKSSSEYEMLASRLHCEVEQLKKAAAVCKAAGGSPLGTGRMSRELEQCRRELEQREAESRALAHELTLMRGSLEARRNELCAVAAEHSLQVEALEARVAQLQSALAKDRAELKSRLVQSEDDKKKILDLTRQVKEMERILKRKHPNSISALIMAANSEMEVPDNSPRIKYLENRVQQLEQELQKKGSEESNNFQHIQDQFHAMKVRYDQQVAALELELGTAKHEANQARLAQEAASRLRQRQVPMCSTVVPPASAIAVREDSHLVATIRGLRSELVTREREVQRLGRELEDSRRAVRRLQAGRVQRKTSDDVGHRPTSANNLPNQESARTHEEAVASLEQQNSCLRRDLQKLEEEYHILKMKRIQDLNLLQEQHEAEMQRVLSRQAEPERDLGSRVAELQSQLCTQKLIVSQLREQLKQLNECQEEIAVLRTERDHLERTTMELNKKLVTLRRAQMPEEQRYEALQERILELESRHELREERLQVVVRDLLHRNAEQRAQLSQRQRGGRDDDASSLRERLLDKNRQLCHYQAEMDRILEALQGLHRGRGD